MAWSNITEASSSPYIPAISGGGSYVLNNPSAVAFSSAGDAYVLDISGASAGILKFSGTTYDGQIVNFNSTTTLLRADLTIGPDGKLYVSGLDDNEGEGEVLDFNLDGTGGSVYVSGLNNPTFLAFAAPEPSTVLLVLAGFRLRRHCAAPGLQAAPERICEPSWVTAKLLAAKRQMEDQGLNIG